MEKSKFKEYVYELLEERPLSLIIKCWTRDKSKFYQFAVPKSMIESYTIYEKVEEKVVKEGKSLYVKGERTKEIKIVIEPKLMYKATWFKIQDYVEKLGNKARKTVKTWHR